MTPESMKPSYGLGILVVVLIAAAAALLGAGLSLSVSLAMLLAGLWTLVAAFTLVGSGERGYYAGWGVILACLSLSYFIPIQDAIALILIAIVGLIVASAYYTRAPKAAPSPAGGAPSAAS